MTSYKVLISDSLPSHGRELLERSGEFEVFEGQSHIPDLLPEIHGWIVRSATQVTAEYLELATNLRCVCRAGAGVDNIDREAATRHGVVVMNTPGSNSMAAGEHAIALMLSLARNIPFAHATMMNGGWGKKNYAGVEVEGKALGVLGLGKIGRIVAQKARGLGMQVIGYDPYVNPDVEAELGIELTTDLDAVFSRVDFLTLHTPATDSTQGLIRSETLAKCKPNLRIINCSRGAMINEKDLLEAIEKGIVAGAALDVFSSEPLPEDSPLRNHPRIITTPHLGASTLEAQEQVAVVSARQIRDHLLHGTVENAVNAVSVGGEDRLRYAPFARLAERLGSLQAQALSEQPQSITVEIESQEEGAGGELLEQLVVDHALIGFLGSSTEVPVNVVNARLLAKDRGLEFSAGNRSGRTDWLRSISVVVNFPAGSRRAEGALIGKDTLRLVHFDGYDVDAVLEGPIIITFSEDRPGMVGHLGNLLGSQSINIANLSLGRDKQGGTALAVFNLDTVASRSVIDSLLECDGVTRAASVEIE